MLKKPSDPSYWFRFSPPDDQDRQFPRQDRLLNIWIQAGRLPKLPYEEFPWSPEHLATYIEQLKEMSPPPDISRMLPEFEAWLKSPEVSARLKEASKKRVQSRRATSKERGTHKFLVELDEKGVDGHHLLDLLAGRTPKQPVNLFFLTLVVRRLAYWFGSWQPYNQHLLKLWQHYTSKLPLLEDEVFRPDTRRLLREDLDSVFRCIRVFQFDKLFRRTAPEVGITANPTTDLSRQGFWEKPVLALVDYLSPILGSNANAYKATAHLFHLLFEYPDKPHLVKLRYLRARRKQGPRHRHR